MESEIILYEKLRPGQEVFTGFPGQYMNAPEEPGTYRFIEIVHENEDGQLVHDDFEFEKE